MNDSFNIFGQVFSMLQLRQNVKNMRREKNVSDIYDNLNAIYVLTTFTSRSQLSGGLFIQSKLYFVTIIVLTYCEKKLF